MKRARTMTFILPEFVSEETFFEILTQSLRNSEYRHHIHYWCPSKNKEGVWKIPANTCEFEHIVSDQGRFVEFKAKLEDEN